MSGKYSEPLSDTALEHIMRDVLSGLEDFSNRAELDCQVADMEIIYIRPANRTDTAESKYNTMPAPARAIQTLRARNLRLLQ